MPHAPATSRGPHGSSLRASASTTAGAGASSLRPPPQSLRRRRRRAAPLLSDASVRSLRAAFKALDSDGDGRLSTAQLRQLLLALRVAPPDDAQLAEMAAAAAAARPPPSTSTSSARDGSGSDLSATPAASASGGSAEGGDGGGEGAVAAGVLLDFEAFLRFVSANLVLAAGEEEREPARLFAVFDVEGKGSVDAVDVMRVLNDGFAMRLTRAEVDAMIAYADEGNDGQLDLREFLAIHRRVMSSRDNLGGADVRG